MTKITHLNDAPADLKDIKKDLFQTVEVAKRFVDLIMEYNEDDQNKGINICVQGEWGSGKSTLLNTIQQLLESQDKNQKILIKSFDIAVYENIADSNMILYYFVEHIFGNSLLKNIKEVFLNNITLKNVVSKAIQYGENQLNLSTDEYKKINSSYDSTYKKINELKENFGKKVNEFDKVVILIDNLDRVNPIKAVDFLELIKYFFDNDKIYNIVAVDFDIITQGMRMKYNIDNEYKSISFFEKFFQLNYRLYPERFDIKKFLTEYLDDFDEKSYIVKLLQSLNIKNPRKLKQIINSLNFHRTLMDINGRFKNKKYHYAIIICENYSQDIFKKILKFNTAESIKDYINEKEDYLLEDFVDAIFGKKIDECSTEYAEFYSILTNKFNYSVKLQNHSPNLDVQILMRKIFNKICIDKQIDLDNRNNIGKETSQEREGNINEVIVKKLKNHYTKIKLTSGKGQGIYLYSLDNQKKIYFSGDYAGNLFNDGLQLNDKKIKYIKNRTVNQYQTDESIANLIDEIIEIILNESSN